MKYIERIIDSEIKEKLSYTGAVVIKGPKWCGKTTSAKQVAKSVLEMQNPDLQDNYIELANTKPSLLLEGDKPRLIDEWQIVPKLWNAVRYSVDSIALPGQYLLTGSSVPPENDELHSGVGRFAYVTMKPMTLYESGDSNGSISLKEILNGNLKIEGQKTDLDYEKVAYVLCRGGWPASITLPAKQALEVPKNYIDVLCNSDISRVDGIKRDPYLAKLILKAYARQVSTIDSNQTIYDDVKANYSDISERTLAEYMSVLKKLYVIEEIEAWNPNIRSKTAIRTSPKKSMIDPSLAVAVLGVTPKEIMLDIRTYGMLFENLVNRDLSVYVNANGGELKHYRDRYGLECDNILCFGDGRYALVETKLGGPRVKEAEEHLLSLKNLILANEPKLGEPEFMMVITAGDMAYTTEQGVLVVPIGCLKD